MDHPAHPLNLKRQLYFGYGAIDEMAEGLDVTGCRSRLFENDAVNCLQERGFAKLVRSNKDTYVVAESSILNVPTNFRKSLISMERIFTFALLGEVLDIQALERKSSEMSLAWV